MTRRQSLALLFPAPARPRRILFTGRGRSGFLNPDRRLEWIDTNGGGLRELPLGSAAGQSGWGYHGALAEGRLLLMSLELPADWRSRAFDDYYPRSRTRLWGYDTRGARLEELCHRGRLSSFYSPCCVLPGGARVAVTALIDGKSVLYTMNLDGGEARAVTGPGEFVYGVSLSPDGREFAFHANYRIHVCGIDGRNRRQVTGGPRGHLYFGTSWSTDGHWVLFQACDGAADPAHDWSRIGIVNARGGEDVRWLTPPSAAWFGASFGPIDNPGGGSNQPVWAGGAQVLYVRRIPGSVTPWEFQAGRRDTDHFNREFKPALARGGTHLALVDAASGQEREFTSPLPGQWDFRAAWDPHGAGVAFCRAAVGADPELCVASKSGGGIRRLTRGMRGAGVEHPAWLPA